MLTRKKHFMRIDDFQVMVGKNGASCNSFYSNPCPGNSRSWETPERADNV